MCIKYRALFNDHVDIQHSPHDGLPDQTGISIKSGGVQLLLLLHSTLEKILITCFIIDICLNENADGNTFGDPYLCIPTLFVAIPSSLPSFLNKT